MKFVTPLMEQLQSMWLRFVTALPNIGLAVLALLGTWVLALACRSVFGAMLRRSRLRPSLTEFLLTTTTVIVWTLGVLIALAIVFPSLTPAKLLATIGLGSVAIGFAFKDVFENFLAGALIMLRKPMRIGDFIECGEVTGHVEKITIRDSYVRKTDGVLILVPNSYIFKNPVFIETDRKLRRFEIICGVAYGEDVDEAQKVIREALEGLDAVDTSRSVQVFAREFNSSSIDFTVRWWADSAPIGMHKSRDQVVRAIKRALDDAKIEIPFPYRTMTFPEPLEIVQDTSKAPEGESSGS